MVMMANKVYVPLVKTTSKDVVAPTKIDTPQYPDSGVSYAGYSKKLLAGNQFKLKPQTPVDSNLSYSFPGGGATLDYNLLAYDANYFITDIFLSTSFTSATTLNFNDSLTGRLFLCIRIPAGVFNQALHFETPIALRQALRITFSPNFVLNDIINLNFYGWSEEL